ncbi:FKBP-type peptidyl-prolyl cis-trans isomerase [Candidatus Vesicomyidisocius calyptogenae]|uniref:Peptidyl-prolyl cis-trans isomerase n=1 Tax=Vesicomyosocius okutanii subsp. Calyptogena okutanii (strain HA) TaxID=412965 RepID=A5CY24_VESOH|nr:FKBP-type peptidyl-prolyl cis-trans isomerase [Candidatus Vesicomyosocius okutanii]BAF61159.1 peptidyl-prolyl cis-trans isomerase [Candidatus Vesicomyosocius okutanii]
MEDLEIQNLKIGTGAACKAGDFISMHYTGWFIDGKKFDSSVDRNETFNFKLGVGQVILGWDQGINGMCIGGKRKLIIPSKLAYGEMGSGNLIPSNTTLIFEVELLAIQ